MEKNNIYQWSDVYPTEEDFMEDIKNHHMEVGMIDNKIAVIYTVNKEYDNQYLNGKWRMLHGEFRVIHRLCVNPEFQNKGLAKEAISHIEIRLPQSHWL